MEQDERVLIGGVPITLDDIELDLSSAMDQLTSFRLADTLWRDEDE